MEDDRLSYRSALKDANKLITAAQASHLNQTVADCDGQPRKLWNTVSNLLHNNKQSVFSFDSAELCLAACNNFCKFFSDRVGNIYNNIAINRPAHNPLPQHKYSGPSLAAFQPVTLAKVSKLSHSMPLSACTLDFVPPSLIKSCSHIFIPILTHLANLSLLSGVFPSTFKLAQITLHFKKPNL